MQPSTVNYNSAGFNLVNRYGEDNDMKLTEKDKGLLLKWGYSERDFAQIEEATRRTIYIYCGKEIDREKVIYLLGDEQYLSGISRSTFHFSATRETRDGHI